MGQNQTILRHLKTAGPITSMDAIRRYGITRCAARIADLRDDGHRIKTTMHESGEPGNAGNYASYRLIEDNE